MIDLGDPTETYTANMKTFYILLAVAVICCLIGIISVWSGISRFNAPIGILDEMGFGKSARKNGLITSIIIASINLIVSGGCVAAALFQKSVRLEIYENGLVSQRGKKREAMLWKEIQQVKEHKFDSVTQGPNLRRRAIRFFVTIHTDDGREVLLRGIENVRAAGARVASRCGLELEKIAI